MQKRGEQTRERILQAAMLCFSRSGYSSSGVAEICFEAGVSKGAFYHHFESKQSVFIELINSWLSALDANLNTARNHSQDVPVALLEMSGLFDVVFRQASNRLPMFLEIWLQASRDPAVWEALITPYMRFQTFFKDLISSGIDEGSLRDVDSNLAARALLSLAVGLLLQSLLDPVHSEQVQVAEEGFRIFTNGLRKVDH